MNANLVTKIVLKGLAAVVALGASVRLTKEANKDSKRLKEKSEK